MNASPFDPTAYYRLSNVVTGPGLTLSLGLHNLPPPPIQMTPTGAYSSENWQFFYDSGIYFIRNYDYGAEYQLGVAEDVSVPSLLEASGALGMQWNLSHWGDGTWSLKNGLLTSLPLFAVSIDYAAGGVAVPAMNLDQTNAHWTTDINLSAGRIADNDMLNPFPSIEAALPTSASTSDSIVVSTSVSTAILTDISTATLTTASHVTTTGSTAQNTSLTSSSQVTSTPSQSVTPVSTSTSTSFSKGAIAGMVVGGLSVLIMLAAL